MFKSEKKQREHCVCVCVCIVFRLSFSLSNVISITANKKSLLLKLYQN